MNIIAQKFTNPVVGNTIKGFEDGASDRFLEIYIPRGVGMLFIAGSIFFFFQLLTGSISWIVSNGDKNSVEGSKNKITHSIIGFVLLISTFALVKIIEGFLDIDILSIDIGPLFIR